MGFRYSTAKSRSHDRMNTSLNWCIWVRYLQSLMYGFIVESNISAWLLLLLSNNKWDQLVTCFILKDGQKTGLTNKSESEQVGGRGSKRDWQMDLSENESGGSQPQQACKHFLRDVVFHGKFHVSVACFSVSLRKLSSVYNNCTSTSLHLLLTVVAVPFHWQFDKCIVHTVHQVLVNQNMYALMFLKYEHMLL